MCRLFWSFAAHIYDEYLNHMNWYKQLGLILHYIPCFRAGNQRRLWRDCANVQSRQIICCSHMWYVSWTGPKIMAWTFIYIPSVIGILCSHMRLIPNFLELAYKFLAEPSSTYLLLNMICTGSGETERICCLAWFFAARICDLIPKFLELDYEKNGWAFTYIPSFKCYYLRLCWECANVPSHLILFCPITWWAPTSDELTYKQ